MLQQDVRQTDQIQTTVLTPDVELASALVADLAQKDLPPQAQIQQEVDLERLAHEEGLSPLALQVIMAGIYSSAQNRHPSRFVPTGGEPSPYSQNTAEISPTISDEMFASIPEGFKSWRFISKGALLPEKQFYKVVYSLANPDELIVADTFEGVTDTGKRVRLCDLRPHMTSNVRRGGPTRPDIIRLLDKDVQRDVLLQANAGRGGKTVAVAPKIHYSTRNGTKARAYWMLVDDQNAKGALTVARIADCDDKVDSEKNFYRRVLRRRANSL
jgi:hypothetical protein